MNSKDVPQIIEHVNAKLDFTPFKTLWIPDSARLVVLGENPRRTGSIVFYKLDISNKTKELKLDKKYIKTSGIKCGTFDASPKDTRLLATGDMRGNLCIWDISKMTSPFYNVSAHNNIINDISGCGGLMPGGYGQCELLTCSRDGIVKLWDPRINTSVVELQPNSLSEKRDCWCCNFGNSYNNNNRCIISGYDNGDIKLLDLRINKIYWETNVNNGIVSLEFDRKYIKLNKLLVTTLESKYRLYDMSHKHINNGFSYLVKSSHNSTVWDGKHLSQNRDIWVTCGGNGSISLWNYIYPSIRYVKDKNNNKQTVMGQIKLLNDIKICDQPIISFNWNRNKIGLGCCVSLDQRVRVIISTRLNKL